MKKNIKKKNKERLNNNYRFMLLPIATLIYGFSTSSIAILISVVAVSIVRGDFRIIENTSAFINITIIIGSIIFPYARKFRKDMLDNS